MITYTDIMQQWLQKMPSDRVACRNMADMDANILALYARDILNVRGHCASTLFVYTRVGAGPMTVVERATPELSAILTVVQDREDLPLCITASVLRQAMQQAYQQIQERDHVEPAPALR